MHGLAHALGAEDGVDHAVSRSVADVGGKKQDHEREKEAQERPRGEKEEHNPDSQGHDDERPERHAGAADLIREPPPIGRDTDPTTVLRAANQAVAYSGNWMDMKTGKLAE